MLNLYSNKCPKFERGPLHADSQDECRKQNDCQHNFCPLAGTFQHDQYDLLLSKIKGSAKMQG